MDIIPIVIKKSAQGERQYDIISYSLYKRIIFLTGPITNTTATTIIAQLLFLESIDSEKEIHLYINSPGGEINAALAIYDTMNFILPDVHTVVFGMAASCASFLATAGKKGKRDILKNARMMLHEPWGAFQGRSHHFEDHANEIKYMRNRLIDIYQEHTGQDKELLEKWLTRETFFSAEESKEINLIDNIIEKRTHVPEKISDDIILP